MPPNLSWGDSRPYAVLQRTLDKDCRQAEEPKQLVDEAIAGSTWGASANILRSSALALCYSAAECWRWRPRCNQLASSTRCFGSSACLQSLSSVLCSTAYGLESPQDRLGGTHAEGAGHPDKLTVQGTCHMDLSPGQAR